MKKLKDSAKYELVLCSRCKLRIAEETAKLRPKDLLRAKRVAKKSVGWLCVGCRRKMEALVRKRND